MFKTLDRYLIREVAVPFVIGLAVPTFLMVIPPVLQRWESLIASGVDMSTVARALVLLLPQALSLTIPMAVLLGILLGFGRLSADREFVALQACGIGLFRLLRPVAVVALVGTAATAYQIIVALPNANQAFREIAADQMAARLENNLTARVFFEEFPGRVIYVRDAPPEGGWRDVFVADLTRPGDSTVYFARRGGMRLDREKQIVQLHLTEGRSHTHSMARPDVYQMTEFGSTVVNLDPGTVFRGAGPRGAPEKTLAELRATIAEAAGRGEPAYDSRFMLHFKLALPATCPILALIALALGASNRKDGRLAGFAVGSGVIMLYYVLLYGARAFAMGGRLTPEWAPWIPNVVMGIAAIAMFAWRARSGDQPLRLSLPARWRRAASSDRAHGRPGAAAKQARTVLVIRWPRLNLPRLRLLDIYIAREYLRVLLLSAVSLLLLLYISTFIDMVDKLFRGEATTALLIRYLFYQTPQFVHWLIPMSALVATLVTIGVMTKNSELLVMRACGVSLYRATAPLLVFAVAAGGLLFAMQERGLARSNREADRLNRLIRGHPPQRSALNRQWLVGSTGAIYHYDAFDPAANRFSRLRVYDIDERTWDLRSITFAEHATFVPDSERGGGMEGYWKGEKGWVRQLSRGARIHGAAAVRYTPMADGELALDPPGYFKADIIEGEQLMTYGDLMTYAELRSYITRLEASGVYMMPWAVALHRKIAYPFTIVIMTLLAVPFAVTTGRRGALYGIGVGIALALTYLIMLSIFAALGSGGVLPPALAAWAPNILFGAAAIYMVLTVRT
jgi:LPS export ABC transporter permease LptF